ncbi:GH12 family glycosyl hydrolase domain-containing protein [Mucilaginibacter lappiensis]|uniref:Uncharacterized protein n=1 Tax=Mucilaginibacter lappiensis TaxID=354630 RepID=A0A1N7G8Y3_9SPHI|nr:hypothetical protein [Mucilaginibacter lappiensis]MBB6112902.1 hypothetical protein [Mucilaginibacter lappiensis]MBB6131147.1 hypothetical protein [Mucilaginibacter lappiensis]SIS09053.1 Glycosyl hydrolase family 12 [Mucilaginibacter lappiensis]
MKRILTIAVCAVLLSACKKEPQQPVKNSAAVEANWSSSDPWGSWSNGGYTFLNDIWGTGTPAPGPQTIWANSYSNWGVWAQHTGAGIKSYPHVGKVVNMNINSLSSCTSSFNVNNPSGGSYSTDYDIWLNNYAYEVMLWTYKSGAVGPIAGSYDANGGVPAYTNQTIGGHTWNVYNGPGSNNSQVFSFVRTSNTSSGTVDIKAILLWIQSKGWYNNPQLQDIQFGWEITNTDGVGKDFGCASFNISAQ